MTKFIHCSDIHLGKNQYGLEQRALDFANVFNDMVTFAIREKVDFVLIAGDLFEKPNIHPIYFNQALNILKRLRESNIPVYAIRGNHDGKLTSREWSWLRILNNEGYLKQFIPRFSHKNEDKGKILSSWNESNKTGSFIELHGLRIAGMGYYGSFTQNYLDQLSQEIPNDDIPNLLMLHAGLEGYYPPMGGGLLEIDHLKELEEKIDYLAMGHVHQSFSHKNWIHNAGSLENWEVREFYKDHGFFLVEQKGNEFQLELKKPRRREYIFLNLQVESCSSFNSLFDEFKKIVKRKISYPNFRKNSIIYVTLEGELKFSSFKLDLQALREYAQIHCQALTVQIRNITTIQGIKFEHSDERISRNQLEKQVFEHLIKQDVEWSKYAADLADELIDIKPLLYQKADPDQILDKLRNWRANIENK